MVKGAHGRYLRRSEEGRNREQAEREAGLLPITPESGSLLPPSEAQLTQQVLVLQTGSPRLGGGVTNQGNGADEAESRRGFKSPSPSLGH